MIPRARRRGHPARGRAPETRRRGRRRGQHGGIRGAILAVVGGHGHGHHIVVGMIVANIGGNRQPKPNLIRRAVVRHAVRCAAPRRAVWGGLKRARRANRLQQDDF